METDEGENAIRAERPGGRREIEIKIYPESFGTIGLFSATWISRVPERRLDCDPHLLKGVLQVIGSL